MMKTEITYSHDFPLYRSRVFLVGIGGIGMSGLAQLLCWMGYLVAGSDRGLDEPARAHLYDQLRAQGIRLYPQDGSGLREFPAEALVVSTAIEPDNADLAAAPGVPVFHRAFVLARLCEEITRTAHAPLIGVAGSCGKTSVAGWIASALRALGQPIVLIDGGYTLDFETREYPGNFHGDACPNFIVAEIDESDRSIREFRPDYSVVLNVGHDHYGMDELREVFRDFLARAKSAAFYPESEPTLAPTNGVTAIPFSADAPGYAVDAHGIRFDIYPDIPVRSTQVGRYSAVNGAVVYQVLKRLFAMKHPQVLAEAMEAFRGVRQRFEVMSAPDAKVAVVNDFAHNPEKLAAAIGAARERYGSPLAMAWQPHGFKALGDQRGALQEALAKVLQADDQFLMLPVYYAGGTTSGTPTSVEVAAQYAAAGLPVAAVADRAEAEARFRAMPNAKAWLVLGARDASLRTWTHELAKTTDRHA